jgi:WhiB family redox-sensing transcriptional regulator
VSFKGSRPGSGPPPKAPTEPGTRRGKPLVLRISPWASDRLWMRRAACVGRDDLYFGPHGEPEQERRARVAKAKQLCATCPVLAECRETVDRMEGGQVPDRVAGIWAGETPRERHNRRRRMSA